MHVEMYSELFDSHECQKGCFGWEHEAWLGPRLQPLPVHCCLKVRTQLLTKVLFRLCHAPTVCPMHDFCLR